MSVQQNSFSACLFCYKTVDNYIETEDNIGSVTINKFIKVLNRFRKTLQRDLTQLGAVFLEKDCDNGQIFFKCCTKCKKIVTNVCEIFHQLKLLEMRLDWKLDKLARTINHANKVPARWINFNKVLEINCQNDLGKKMTSKRAIRELRESVVTTVDQRKLELQPRVHLKRTRVPTAQYTNPESSTSGLTVNTKPNERFIISQANCRKLYNGNLVCQKCGKKLSTFVSLHSHMEIHTGILGSKWGCAQCGKQFICESKLTRHMNVHTKPHACRFCGIKFSTKTNLTDHLKMEHGNERDLQSELNKLEAGSTEKVGFEDEGENINNQNLNFEQDPLESTTIFQDPLIETKVEQLTIVRDVPNNSESQPVRESAKIKFVNNSMKISVQNKTCLKCNKTFPNRNRLLSHITTTLCSGIVRLEKFPCKICGTEFRKQDCLKRHMEYHKSPEEWTIKCEKCGKLFATKGCLSQHLKIHDQVNKVNEKTFKCRYCERRYANKRNLNGHMDRVHWKEKRDSKVVQEKQIKSFEKSKVECKICGRRFPSVLKNNRHFRMVHGSSKLIGETFKCIIDGCKAYFLRMAQLQIHLKSEHGGMTENEKGKRLKCRFCGKGYNCEAKLVKHLNNLHKSGLKEDLGENDKKNFRCKYCENRYYSRRCVDQHIYEVHWKEKEGVNETEGNLKAKFKFECKICLKRFSRSDRKERHFKAYHDLKGKSLKETLKCGREGCGAYFLRRDQLSRHGRMEHGVVVNGFKRKKKIKCGYCKRKCLNKHGLRFHMHLMHSREMKREKERLIRGNSEEEEDSEGDDYEVRAIEEIIRQERENRLDEREPLSGLEDEGLKELARDTIENRSVDSGDNVRVLRIESVDAKSVGCEEIETEDSRLVEVKPEVNYEVILNELEIGEDEEDNYGNSEMSDLTEVRGEMEVDEDDEDLNTFGRNMVCLDQGALAELEDLD